MRLRLCLLNLLVVCFNPRICKRCDHFPSTSHSLQKVSIHASVKDATEDQNSFFRQLQVSIHASVKDATSSPYLYNWLYWCFNPRICKRCDLSLHPLGFPRLCFNPRICKRCDSVPLFLFVDTKMFQSTHL